MYPRINILEAVVGLVFHAPLACVVEVYVSQYDPLQFCDQRFGFKFFKLVQGFDDEVHGYRGHECETTCFGCGGMAINNRNFVAHAKLKHLAGVRFFFSRETVAWWGKEAKQKTTPLKTNMKPPHKKGDEISIGNAFYIFQPMIDVFSASNMCCFFQGFIDLRRSTFREPLGDPGILFRSRMSSPSTRRSNHPRFHGSIHWNCCECKSATWLVVKWRAGASPPCRPCGNFSHRFM